MMDMSADLRDYWKALSIADGRVYRDERPQGTGLPAVVMQVISEPRDPMMKGEHALNQDRLQVNCLALSRWEANALRDTILANRPLRAIIGKTNVRRMIVDLQRQDSDRPAGPPGSVPTDSPTVFRTIIDLMVWSRPVS